LVFEISFSLSQSDPIKGRLLNNEIAEIILFHDMFKCGKLHSFVQKKELHFNIQNSRHFVSYRFFAKINKFFQKSFILTHKGRAFSQNGTTRKYKLKYHLLSFISFKPFGGKVVGLNIFLLNFICSSYKSTFERNMFVCCTVKCQCYHFKAAYCDRFRTEPDK
jgi:hypothetical protein